MANILFLTFYYRPDLCAGSFRASPLVDSLSELISQNDRVDVITTMPNRYVSYKLTPSKVEINEKTTIHRVSVPQHKSGFVDQSFSFLVFAARVLSLTRSKDYDIVIATSSRLMTAFLGAVIARRKNAKLYLDIRDLFGEIMRELLPGHLYKPLIYLFSLIEKWTLRQANALSIVSPAFEDHVRKRCGRRRIRLFTNGIDEEFFSVSPEDNCGKSDVRTILYAGNIGFGQGLEKILPELGARLGDKYFIVVVGDGGRRDALVRRASEIASGNVQVLNPVDRSELIRLYQSADVLFIHLNDCDTFRLVLPSKIFEYAASGKPILAGLSGYAAKFAESEIINCAVFAPCDVDACIVALSRLDLRSIPRTEFLSRYRRSTIMNAMAKDILRLREDTATGTA